MSLKRTHIIFITATLIGVVLLAGGGRVYADQPPLTPGCYGTSGIVYTKVNCDTPERTTSTQAPLNKCFSRNVVAQGVGPFVEIACSTGAPASTTVSEEVGCADADGNRSDDGSGGNKNTDGSCKVPTDCSADQLNEGNCAILNRLLQLINILSGLVGVVVVMMIIIGGIQYSTAGSDSQKISAAKRKIFNALLALFAYIFMYSFLQWIVPGGIF